MWQAGATVCCGVQASHCAGGFAYGTQALGTHRLQQMQCVGPRVCRESLLHTGLVAPHLVESSWTMDQTPVPCLDRQDSLPLSHQGSPSVVGVNLSCGQSCLVKKAHSGKKRDSGLDFDTTLFNH